MSLYSFRDDAMKLADKMSRSLWLGQVLRSDAANMLRHLVVEHGCLEARCDRLSKELDSARADVFNLQVDTGEFYGQPRIDRAEAERNAYRAVLRGACYGDLDYVGTLSDEAALMLGKAVADRTMEIAAERDALAYRAREAEIERDAAVEWAEAAEAERNALLPWAKLGVSCMADWPEAMEIEGAELQARAVAAGVLVEVPGGYDPLKHFDSVGIGPEPGDEWFEIIGAPLAARSGEGRSLLDHAAKILAKKYPPRSGEGR